MAPSAAVLDIEGTISPTSFVVDILYPYAAARFADWVDRHPDDPAVGQVRAQLGDPDAAAERVVSALLNWSRADRKVTALKTIQGRIWERGFATGDLAAQFFPDALPALRRWRAAGMALYVFSSGSVAAQRAIFGPHGDLIDGYFDTENAGAKRDASSYRAISRLAGVDPAGTVFLSDVRAELDAAGAAGWQTVGVRRPGEPHFAAGVGDHRDVDSFAGLW